MAIIKYIKDDIFNTSCKILINPVNTVGVMGAGLAKQFKIKYPNMFKNYKSKCLSGDLRIGKIDIYKDSNVTIINLPTKEDWRYPSKKEYIEKSLIELSKYILENNIKEISMTKIGCGLGGLNWNNDVLPIVKDKLPKGLKINVYDF